MPRAQALLQGSLIASAIAQHTQPSCSRITSSLSTQLESMERQLRSCHSGSAGGEPSTPTTSTSGSSRLEAQPHSKRNPCRAPTFQTRRASLRALAGRFSSSQAGGSALHAAAWSSMHCGGVGPSGWGAPSAAYGTTAPPGSSNSSADHLSAEAEAKAQDDAEAEELVSMGGGSITAWGSSACWVTPAAIIAPCLPIAGNA